MKSAIVSVVAVIVLILVLSWVNAIRVPTTIIRQVGQCTTNVIGFSVSIDRGIPSALVLAVPRSSTNALSFSGEVIVSRATGMVARIPIGTVNLMPCNWIHQRPDLADYILTWNTNKAAGRFFDALSNGEPSNILITFSKVPPPECSLWFSSIKLVGFFTQGRDHPITSYLSNSPAPSAKN